MANARASKIIKFNVDATKLENYLKTKSVAANQQTASNLASSLLELANELKDNEKIMLASFYQPLTEKNYDKARNAYLTLLNENNQKYVNLYSYLRFEDIEILLHENRIPSDIDYLKKYQDQFRNELDQSPQKALAFIFAINGGELSPQNEDAKLLSSQMNMTATELFGLYQNGENEHPVIKLAGKYPDKYQDAMKSVATHYQYYNFQDTFEYNSLNSTVYKRMKLKDPLIRHCKMNFNNDIYNNVSSFPPGISVNFESAVNADMIQGLKIKINEKKKIYGENNDFIKALEKLATDLEKSDDQITSTCVAICTGDMLDKIGLSNDQNDNQRLLDNYLEDTSKLVGASLFSKAIRALLNRVMKIFSLTNKFSSDGLRVFD